jgi:hypothetical protein
MPRLIGINGLKTAGKDTAYQEIADAIGCEGGVALRAAFADKLKIMAMLALGYKGEPGELIRKANMLKEDGGSVSSHYITPAPFSGSLIPTGMVITGRQYLQEFGQYARVVFGESFWVDQVLPPPDGIATGIAGHLHDSAYAPLQAIIDPWTGEPRGAFNFLCITDVRYPNEAERVLRLGGETWEIVRPGLESDGHSSENPLPRELVTRVIVNDGTVDDLREKVVAAL